MFKEIVASKAAKYLAACVCPVAGTATITATVPQVRDAVHRATTPRAVAAPRSRVRQAEPQAIAATPCVIDNPLILPTSLASLPPFDLGPAGSLTPLASALPGVPGGLVPAGRTPGPGEGGSGENPNPPTPPSVVPEPSTWVQLIVGFGLVGGATRFAMQSGRLQAVGPAPAAEAATATAA